MILQSSWEYRHSPCPILHGFFWAESLKSSGKTSPFCSGYFGVLLFAQSGLEHQSYFMLSDVSEMTGEHHHTLLFSVDLGSCKLFFAWDGLGLQFSRSEPHK
jgi:hypothetical protein